jgi:hypothetical protein
LEVFVTFLAREKRRLGALKPRLFSAAAQGKGRYGKNGEAYPFCLADGHSDENLHESVREEALRYFKNRDIPWHDGFPDAEGDEAALPSSHLCCSQCACVNALAPMMRDGELLARALRLFLPELKEPLSFDADKPLHQSLKPFLAFEWIGTKAYFDEKNRMRGANATSADFAFRFRRYDARVQLVLGEWKYTERYTQPLPSPEDINETRRETYHKPFERWRARQPSLPVYEVFFADPFYQLMRLTLLAQEMEDSRRTGAGEMGADVVTVLHVSPKANTDFATSFTSPTFSSLGPTVTSAWGRLCSDGRFLALSSESLLTAIEQAAPERMKGWKEWLLLRYGWWREGPGQTRSVGRGKERP